MTFERSVNLGRDSHGDITGGEERSTLVLGPTRSGKTSSFIIPNLLLTTSPSVTTSTKTDVVNLMARARHDGATMLFDPSGTVSALRGVLRVGCSPIRQAQTWDGSVLATRTRGFAKGVQPASDVLTSRVRCGLCGKRMSIQQNGKGSTFYKCWSRGQGCDQPVRSTKGLSRAAVLGMSLLGTDEDLQAAIRRRLAGRTRTRAGAGRGDRRPAPAVTLGALSEHRRKLLELYFEGKISADGFKEAEDRLCADVEIARAQAAEESLEVQSKSDLEQRFEEVARILSDLDVETVWKAAEDRERRVLVEELVEWVTVFPDHLEVTVAGAPALNVRLEEVGLKGSEIVGVGGPT